MTFAPRNIRLIITHLSIWLFYILYESSLLLFIDSAHFNYAEVALNFLLYAMLFYSNGHVLLPRLYARRRYFTFALMVLALFAVYAALRGLVNIELLPALGQTMLRPVSSEKLFWAQTVSRGIYFLMLSFAYWFARNAIGLERRQRQQQVQLRLTEKSLLEAEVAFLKSQINPHFLFNALNFLYAQVYPLSEDAARSILLLSTIMRYALKETGENGKVMLEEEVHHLQNYITINQLRFSNRLQIQFEVEGCCEFLMILPLVLITFVENCFKHGELFDPAHPVLLRLTMRDNALEFFTHNRKRAGPIEHSTGIGLENTRRRLEAVYPGRFELRLIDTPATYATHLHLSL